MYSFFYLLFVIVPTTDNLRTARKGWKISHDEKKNSLQCKHITHTGAQIRYHRSTPEDKKESVAFATSSHSPLTAIRKNVWHPMLIDASDDLGLAPTGGKHKFSY